MSKDWGDGFGRDDDDYKVAWLEEDRRRQDNSTVNWIYIGFDTQRDVMSKVGLTTGKLGTRASGSQNPFYMLFCAFKIKEDVDSRKVHEIEDSIIMMLEEHYERIKHVDSGRPSEWFYARPAELKSRVLDFLCDRYSSYMHGYYCDVRDVNVIFSWENPRVRGGKKTGPYRAADLSDPPVAFECFMPQGCDECDCGR